MVGKLYKHRVAIYCSCSPFFQACGGSIQTSVGSMTDDVLGQCELFEEVQVGGER